MGDEFALGRLKSEWRSPGNSSGWQGGAGKERVAIAHGGLLRRFAEATLTREPA